MSQFSPSEYVRLINKYKVDDDITLIVFFLSSSSSSSSSILIILCSVRQIMQWCSAFLFHAKNDKITRYVLQWNTSLPTTVDSSV